MKIIFLSPAHPLLTPDDPLPKWQMQMSRIRALVKLGHQVKVIKYTPDNKMKLSLRERIWWNFRVIWEIGEISAEGGSAHGGNLIIYSLGADVLLPATIWLVKLMSGAKLIAMSGVSPITSGNPRERSMAKQFNLVLTNDDAHSQQWLKLGAKRAINLPLSAMDPELHFPRKVKARDIDVLFIGTFTAERKLFLKRIRKLLPVAIKTVFAEFAWEEEYAALMSRAKIILNPLRGEMENGANLRMFEAPAFGALLLGNSGKKEWLWPGREMAVYNDTEDAAKKIIYYLENKREREKIAENGMKRVKSEHTFLDRTKKMMNLLESS